MLRRLNHREAGFGGFGARPARARGALATFLPLKIAVLGIITTFLFLPYFGIGLTSEFAISLSLIAMYAVLPVLFLYKSLSIDPQKLLLYFIFVYSVMLSWLSATNGNISMTSMLYLIILYFPFCFRMRSSELTDHFYDKTIAFFLDFSTVVAIIAIIQFFSQFVVKLPWLFNISLLIPEVIVDRGAWNTGYDTGSFLKANGFFLREPSELSLILGFAVLIEFLCFRRLLRLLIYAFALVLSFSGTGIFLLAAALLIPARPKAFLRAAALIVIGWIAFTVIDGYIADGFFLNRLDEFNREGTSAWARFVAPQFVISEGMSNFEKAMLGNGPGSIAPATVRYAAEWYDSRFQIHGPTWAKLLYEYGIVGTVAAVLFTVFALWRGRGPVELKIGALYGWLASGGQLLSPTYCAIMFVLVALWPKQAAKPRSINTLINAKLIGPVK